MLRTLLSKVLFYLAPQPVEAAYKSGLNSQSLIPSSNLFDCNVRSMKKISVTILHTTKWSCTTAHLGGKQVSLNSIFLISFRLGERHNFDDTNGKSVKVLSSWRRTTARLGSNFLVNFANVIVLDTQEPPLEKCHSSPSRSKPSPSEGQSQSPSRGGYVPQARPRSSKSAAWQQRHQDGGAGSGLGVAIATTTMGDTAPPTQQQQQPVPPQRLQPSKPRRK